MDERDRPSASQPVTLHVREILRMHRGDCDGTEDEHPGIRVLIQSISAGTCGHDRSTQVEATETACVQNVSDDEVLVRAVEVVVHG